MNMRSIISAAACALIAVSAAAQAPKAPEYEFTVVKENPVTSIKNQYRSGTCWCYSALSFIESEILRTKGQEVDLSEMFVVGKSYRDRAVKYVRLDGHLNFAAGSSFGDVFHVINDYGIVPQDAMPGFNYGTDKPEHNELDAALKGYVEAIVKNPNRKLSTAWVNGFDGIVAAYFGEIFKKLMSDLPQKYGVYYNVNFPNIPADQIKGAVKGQEVMVTCTRTGNDFATRLNISARQADIRLAGGLLNYAKEGK